MASLQIRHLPDDVYLALAFRAAQAHRSLAQQTVIELRRSTDSSSGQRRRAVLQKISALLSVQAPAATLVQPEQVTEWIREDRERGERGDG
jgi:plasmid stability protein